MPGNLSVLLRESTGRTRPYGIGLMGRPPNVGGRAFLGLACVSSPVQASVNKGRLDSGVTEWDR